MQTYYRDADEDTLGSLTDTTSVCSWSAPSGYVSNASDTNDAQAYFSASGAANGAVNVTYGDGSSIMYTVFSVTTQKLTTVSVYKDSQYLLVIAPWGKRIAVIDAYTGAVLGLRAIPTRTGALDTWLSGIIGF
jgi:hypothetical protein